MCQLAATVTAPEATIGSKLPLSEYEMPASMVAFGSIGASVAGSEAVVPPAPQPASATLATRAPASSAVARRGRRRRGFRNMVTPVWMVRAS